jgi:hypothetical protein
MLLDHFRSSVTTATLLGGWQILSLSLEQRQRHGQQAFSQRGTSGIKTYVARPIHWKATSSKSYFIKVIQRYPGVHRIVFALKSKKVPEKMKIKQLILMLLVSSILTFQVRYNNDNEKHKNPNIVARLNIDTEDELCVSKDSHWIEFQ